MRDPDDTPLRLAGIPVPSSAVAGAAVEAAQAFSPPALVNHCARSYLFAASLAAATGITVDHELLFVATMLHDLGLEPAFDNHTLPFEHAGGHAAWMFAAGAGWPPGRRARATQIIVAHMQDVEPAYEPEGYVLAAATSLDISGRRPDLWPGELITEIVRAHPRLDLGTRFTACFQDQAARKPTSSAADAVRSGVAERIAANPLDRI
jgi:hypothetical protein